MSDNTILKLSQPNRTAAGIAVMSTSPSVRIPPRRIHAPASRSTCGHRAASCSRAIARQFPGRCREQTAEHGKTLAGVEIEWQLAMLKSLGFAGHGAPAIRGPRLPASRRNRAASGQAEAKWMRMRAALSTTRAPILSRFFLRVANSAQASGIRRGTASHRERLKIYATPRLRHRGWCRHRWECSTGCARRNSRYRAQFPGI